MHACVLCICVHFYIESMNAQINAYIDAHAHVHT
jgi:hypothetical protein